MTHPTQAAVRRPVAKRTLSLHTERWPLRTPFRIAGHTWEEIELLICRIEQAGVVGRGEGAGVYYLADTPDKMQAQVAAVSPQIESGISREQLLELLPRGGARNAVDCALWDLEAQLSQRSVWDFTGVGKGPVETVVTVGIEDDPARMAAKAAAASEFRNLKVKLDADRPLERITAVREARPDARLVVDVNQGWTLAQLQRFAPALQELDVAMIEQPLPRGDDGALSRYRSPVPLCADESCLDLHELNRAQECYQMINIKLDKCGGLTAALALATAARGRGLGLMVGNMLGTSLGMAPAHIIGRMADFADLDGPLLLARDRPGGMRYDGGRISPPENGLWGGSDAARAPA